MKIIRYNSLNTLIAVIVSMVSIFRAAAVDTLTGTFDERFRTVTVHVDGTPYDYPAIMVMGSDDTVTISWDELADDRSYLRLSVTHCNADWQPSTLVDSEILHGFNEWTVDEYDFSRATSVPYIHYTITLRADEFKVSGNYLARVWRENDPDEPVLQARFSITERTIPLSGQILTATDVDYRDAHQQLDITADLTYADVESPFNDLRLAVSQNYRPDSRRIIDHPQRASSTTAVYSHLPQLIFDGGNNYRRFETVSVTSSNIGVERVEYSDPYYHALLTEDESRGDLPYLYDLNMRGAYLVRERDASDSDTEADYLVTHFTLNTPRLATGDIYIDSDMTGRRLGPESIMKWNAADQRYETALLLKQGAYSYQYLYVAPGDVAGTTERYEGNSYQTPNIYLVELYQRRRTERYDRLIGTALLTL